MAGTLVIDTLTDGSGNSTSTTTVVRGSAKAWVSFVGSSGTVRASLNVSSVTRSSAGVYVVNFTTAFADTNYAWAVGGLRVAGGDINFLIGSNQQNTNNLAISTCYAYSSPGTFYDMAVVNVAAFR